MGETGFGTCAFSNLRFVAVEVSSNIFEGNDGRVIERDLFGACEDQVFGNFNCELNII